MWSGSVHRCYGFSSDVKNVFDYRDNGDAFDIYQKITTLVPTIKCEQCPVGHFGNHLGCHPCAEGYYSDVLGATACGACGAGMYAENATSCKHCPTGTYSGATAVTFCELCPIGTFSNRTRQINASTCVPCPANTFGHVAGANTCLANCPPGTYALDTNLCETCPAGKYNDKNNSHVCQSCAAGFLLGQGSQLARHAHGENTQTLNKAVGA